jgi:hypothetical protein
VEVEVVEPEPDDRLHGVGAVALALGVRRDPVRQRGVAPVGVQHAQLDEPDAFAVRADGEREPLVVPGDVREAVGLLAGRRRLDAVHRPPDVRVVQGGGEERRVVLGRRVEGHAVTLEERGRHTWKTGNRHVELADTGDSYRCRGPATAAPGTALRGVSSTIEEPPAGRVACSAAVERR